ncbi:hypothetical protein PHYPSEUDO_012208 [Phytophthora pseudosyringae]|uniref:non-specific serine/threonine protein kinase n=1 Tax=Phytophthora pseudosyringae TaxID=221518 RepID=A0A8T1W5I8_9STRA|nr:hypothetical protein PHYPSEUDO_012208 [Phytophthora pseudosyringae]
MSTKWQVQSDDYGNIYFCNSVTGESVWELPDEEEAEAPDETENQPAKFIEKPREQHSVYSVAVGVADVMLKLVETIEEEAEAVKQSKVKRKFMSPAAEKRFLKNAAAAEKKKKHVHDRAVTAYVNALIPKSQSGGSAVEEEDSEKRRQVGSLFTAEESRSWQQERELEREVKRRALRRARRQHQAKVESLQRHQQVLILFRSELMKYLLGTIVCSTELQRQRILLLTTPQMLAEMQERKREMQMNVEPEIAEKMAAEERRAQLKYEKNVRKVFATIDEAGAGKLHLLQILFGVFSKERPQKFAAKSSRTDGAGARLITASEFHEFVSIIEEVLDHYAGLKAAVEDAEKGIEAILAATSSAAGGAGLAQAMMGAMSTKKIQHELAVLKEHDAQLQAVRHREKRRGFEAEGESLVEPKEEWEKNHHHRMIRLEERLPVYCGLCRRRKWELWRREQEEIESEYRCHWPTAHALRVKDEERRFVQERDGMNDIPVEASQDVEEVKQEEDSNAIDIQRTKYELGGLQGHTGQDSIAVQETLVCLVRLVEATATEEAPKRSKVHPRVHKKPASKPPHKRAKASPTTDGQERVKVLEIEERERKTMYTEELHLVIMLERNRRIIERPLLRAQDAAHDAWVRLLEHCVNPSGFLARLGFERCLSFVPPQKLVLAVTDTGVKSQKLSHRLVLQTLPCRTESMADCVFTQVMSMKKTLQSPFVVEVASVDKHMFQLFSELGLLIECWPVVFVVSEYFDCGSWLAHYRKHFIYVGKGVIKYAAVEQHVRSVFREVASGLAAMHSLGLLHLNVNLGNIYLSDHDDAQDRATHVKIGGLLSWKYDYDAANLQGSDMHDCFNYEYAPPEVIKELPITAKADVWMLGCALCDALFMWQRQQLLLSTPHQLAPPAQSTIFHTKAMGELLPSLPIATSASMRSLIRMLLQPNPAQRPQMSQVVDLLCRNNA